MAYVASLQKALPVFVVVVVIVFVGGGIVISRRELWGLSKGLFQRWSWRGTCLSCKRAAKHSLLISPRVGTGHSLLLSLDVISSCSRWEALQRSLSSNWFCEPGRCSAEMVIWCSMHQFHIPSFNWQRSLEGAPPILLIYPTAAVLSISLYRYENHMSGVGPEIRF